MNAKLTASRWASVSGVDEGEPGGGRREASMIRWRRADRLEDGMEVKRAM